MSLVLFLAVAAACADAPTPSPMVALRPLAGLFHRMPTASMAPTLPAGSLLVMEALAGAPVRDDVVLYRNPLTHADLAGRVVGLPGDRIERDETHVLVNGQALPDRGKPLTSLRSTYGHFPDWKETYVVPADSYYVLSDDRTDGLGSMEYGAIARADVAGRLSTWAEATKQKGRMAAILAAAAAPTKQRLPLDTGEGLVMRDFDVLDDTSLAVGFELDADHFRELHRNEDGLSRQLRDDFCANPLIKLATGINITYRFAGPGASDRMVVQASQRDCP